MIDPAAKMGLLAAATMMANTNSGSVKLRACPDGGAVAFAFGGKHGPTNTKAKTKHHLAKRVPQTPRGQGVCAPVAQKFGRKVCSA